MTDQATSAFGQMLPSDWTSEHNAVSFLVRQMIAKMDIMKLVKVTAIHAGEGDPPAGGTVDVQLLVEQVDGRGNAYPHGIVFGLPVSRMQGGKNGIVCDPVVGDFGYVVIADRDGSKVVTNKAQAPPGSWRQNSVADGVYVGMIMAVAPEQYLIFNDTGVRLVDKHSNSVVLAEAGMTLTDSGGNVVQTTASGIALSPAGGKPVTVNGALVVTGALQLGGSILAQNGTEYSGNIQTRGSVLAGDVIANPGAFQVTLGTHIHAANGAPPTPGH